MLFGVITQSPVMAAIGLTHFFYNIARAAKVDPLRAEFTRFVLASMTQQELLEDQLGGVSEDLEDLAREQERLRKVLDKLGQQPDLTATETVAVLAAMEKAYQRAFDPEKRKLLAGALRSLLLNRDSYRGGLRRRFLQALDELVFGDVVALAALEYEDAKLADLVGLKLPDRRHSPKVRVGASEADRVHCHLVALEACGLVYRNPGGRNAQRQLLWEPNELAKLFLAFVEAEPERLCKITESGQPPTDPADGVPVDPVDA